MYFCVWSVDIACVCDFLLCFWKRSGGVIFFVSHLFFNFHYMETTSETDDIGIQFVPLHGNHLRHR
jgi:hypothetical protein